MFLLLLNIFEGAFEHGMSVILHLAHVNHPGLNGQCACVFVCDKHKCVMKEHIETGTRGIFQNRCISLKDFNNCTAWLQEMTKLGVYQFQNLPVLVSRCYQICNAILSRFTNCKFVRFQGSQIVGLFVSILVLKSQNSPD